MQLNATALRVLRLIYRVSSETRPISVPLLAAALGLPAVSVEAALRTLDSQGLIDAARLRLTLTGLALAAAVAAPASEAGSSGVSPLGRATATAA